MPLPDSAEFRDNAIILDNLADPCDVDTPDEIATVTIIAPSRLTDIYEFSDWLKRSYLGPSRKAILITPVQGGLIQVTEATQ